MFQICHALDYFMGQAYYNWHRNRTMGLKLESLDIDGSADELAEYIDLINFWINARLTSDEKTIKGAFLTAGRKHLQG